MKVLPGTLIEELSTVLDPTLALAAVESYIEMEQRFLAGDWKPAELDGGRLCEAVSRCLLQLDTGKVTHSYLPGRIAPMLIDKDNKHQHALNQKDRIHAAKVIEMVYKFRSDRGPVHISPIHNANYMDSMLVLHAGKWLLAELLRLAWNSDRRVVGEVIAQLVQLEHSLVHELDGKPLVIVRGIAAPDEVLLLLNHAPNNRLTRSGLRELTPNQKSQTVSTAISRLIASRDVRESNDGEIALTPPGKKRVMEVILPKYSPRD